MPPELAGLKEMALPEPVAYLPQTSAWYVLFALVGLTVVWLLWRWYRSYRANRYRREALLQLDRIVEDLGDREKHSSALSELPALTKQTALAFAARDQIASFSDGPWLTFLDSTYKGNAFTEGPGRLLPDLSYASPFRLSSLRDDELKELITLLRNWIRRHHARF